MVGDLFPRGGDLSRASFWSGFRPMTPDGTLILGSTQYLNLWLSVCHGALGWTMLPAEADWMAGLQPGIDTDGLGLGRY